MYITTELAEPAAFRRSRWGRGSATNWLVMLKIREVLQRHPLCLHRHPPDRYINTPPYVWLVAMVALTISTSTAGWPKPGSRPGSRARLQGPALGSGSRVPAPGSGSSVARPLRPAPIIRFEAFLPWARFSARKTTKILFILTL